MSTDEQVRAAAATLVAAFADGDVDGYFAAFAPDATFLLHTTDRLLTSREDYRREWDRWEREDGFRVRGCTTRDTVVQDLGGVAVLTHTVRTEVTTAAGEEVLDERETIVFARSADGSWTAVHEHLSPADRLGGPEQTDDTRSDA